MKRKALRRAKVKPTTKARPTLGSRIKEARKSRGMTQRSLAHAIGYKGLGAGAFISRIESGVYHPQLGNLQRIAQALKVSMCELLP